jgi:hypothetical protein
MASCYEVIAMQYSNHLSKPLLVTKIKNQILRPRSTIYSQHIHKFRVTPICPLVFSFRHVKYIDLDEKCIIYHCSVKC